MPAGWLKGLCIWKRSRQQLNNLYWVTYKSFICCDQVQLYFEPWTDEASNGETCFQIKVSHNRKDLVGWLLSFISNLSSELGATQAQREVVKIKKFDFSYWAWSTPWGHVLSLKSFCWKLSWAEQSGTQFFSLSNLLVVSSSCAALCFQLFDIWWSTLDILNDFKAISRIGFFRFGEIKTSLFWVLSKKIFFLIFFSLLLHFKL